MATDKRAEAVSSQDNEEKSRLNPRAKRCKARTRSGERCKNPAVRGWDVCRMHGARGGRPDIVEYNKSPEKRKSLKGNALALKHGAFAKRLLTEEELEVYEITKNILREKYELDEAADEMLLHALAFHWAKWHVATENNVESAAEKHLGRIASLLRYLRIRRDQRVEIAGEHGSPAQWAIAILAKYQTVTGGGKKRALAVAGEGQGDAADAVIDVVAEEVVESGESESGNPREPA